MKLSATLGALALSLVATSATAEVVEHRPDGFRLESRAVIETGTPEAAWAALVRIGDWWSDSHTYSGDASNISIAAEAGGCWCEVWPGGQIEHGRIILAWPEQGLLRASAPLGPLQALPVNAVLTWQVRAREEGGVEIVQTFDVGGGAETTGQLAGPVDGVMSEGMQRLERYLETGSAD